MSRALLEHGVLDRDCIRLIVPHLGSGDDRAWVSSLEPIPTGDGFPSDRRSQTTHRSDEC